MGEEIPKKRVLFVDHTATLSGGEIALLNLVTNMQQSRYEPVVLLCSSGPLSQRLSDAGIETHVVPLAGSIANVKKDSLGLSTLMRLPEVWESLKYTLRLRRFIRQNRIDLVHTNSLKADVLGGMAAKLARVPLIWHIRDRIDADYLPRSVVFVFRLLCRWIPDFVVANSVATLNTIGLDRAERGVAIPSGIDLRSRVVHDGLRHSHASELATSTRKRPRIVGMVGRISRWKGQHIFLQAAAEVHRRFPTVQFKIIGAPLFGELEYEQEIRELVDRLELKNSVEFTGFCEDVPAMIEQLEILVHASVTAEPFGQVVTEGMAAGKPVVATAGGGVLEIVIDGVTGLLVPMGDARSMGNAICNLLEDPEAARRMGGAGRQRVLEQFAIEGTVAKIERVYDEVTLAQRMLSRAPKQHAGIPDFDIFAAAVAIGIAGVAFGVAELLRAALGPHAPLSGLFIIAVACATRLYGARAGVLATIGSVAAAACMLQPNSYRGIGYSNLPALIVLGIASLIVTPMIASLRKAEWRARAAQAAAERAWLESEFVSRSTAAFEVCSEPGSLFKAIGRMATSTLCDWCVVDVLNDDTTISRVFAAHRDPAKYDLAVQLSLLKPPSDPADPLIETILSQTANRLDLAANHAPLDADAAERGKIMVQLGIGPAAAIPLNCAGQTLGILSLVRCDLDRPFRAADLKLANDFASRAASALARLRLNPKNHKATLPEAADWLVQSDELTASTASSTL